jgi:hypothetical protein
MITRKEVLERIEKNDTKWFGKIYNQDFTKEEWKELNVKQIWSLNMGDGNDYDIAFEFIGLGIFALLTGTYSSYDSPEWDDVVIAQPFEFKETRYKKAGIDYLRDQSIEKVLND